MLRISKLADYATIVMVYCGRSPVSAFSAKEIADATYINQPTVSKILKLLTKAGLLTSQRGTKGGYQLARSPEAIDMAEIVTAIDGVIALTECSQHQVPCALINKCGTHTSWQIINHAIFDTLSNISLGNMVHSQVEAKLHMHNSQNRSKTILKAL